MKPTYLPVDAVIVPENRIRREFPDKKELDLCDSIWRLGQLQPIVLKDDHTLQCGERRLRAVTRLARDKELIKTLDEKYGPSFDDNTPIGHIKVVHHADLTLEQQLEAEIEENTHRVDLTWQERAMGTKRLHELRQAQHGAGGRGRKGWTIKDTAEELIGRQPTSRESDDVSNDLLLAEFLDDPLISVAKDEKEAMRTLRDMKKAQRRHQAAREIDATDLHHECILGDAYSILSSWPESDFDAAVCDPPYGRGMHKHKFDQGKHEYDDEYKRFLEFVERAPALLRRVLKPQAHVYIFCDFRHFSKLFVAMEVSGFSVWQWPIIWDKGNVGTFGAADIGPRHCYDCVLYANKGKRPCIAMYRDVINITQEQKLAHPAGKPAALYYDLLRRTVNPGDKVLDPMVGGGTFYPACTELKVYGVGIELSEKYHDMALLMAKTGADLEDDMYL